MAKAILFDIENTLLCPEVPAVQRFAALRLHGEPLFTETTAREAVRQAELWTARQILHELETGTRMDDAQFFQNVCAVYRAAAAQQGAEVDGAIEAALTGRTQWRPAPGVHALLSALGGKYRLGIVSNNRARIRRTLEEAELLPYFSAVTISEEIGVEKPDPRILTMTCEALGVAPAESLYVGDHPFDVLCAERAGMDCAWVDIGLFEPEDLPAQPRWTLHALAELAAVTAL